MNHIPTGPRPQTGAPSSGKAMAMRPSTVMPALSSRVVVNAPISARFRTSGHRLGPAMARPLPAGLPHRLLQALHGRRLHRELQEAPPGHGTHHTQSRARRGQGAGARQALAQPRGELFHLKAGAEMPT